MEEPHSLCVVQDGQKESSRLEIFFCRDVKTVSYSDGKPISYILFNVPSFFFVINHSSCISNASDKAFYNIFRSYSAANETASITQNSPAELKAVPVHKITAQRAMRKSPGDRTLH